MMFLRLLLSPLAFALCFLLPLVTQLLDRFVLLPTGWESWWIAAAVVLPLGLMAQCHGSWIWVKP